MAVPVDSCQRSKWSDTFSTRLELSELERNRHKITQDSDILTLIKTL